MKPLNKKVKVPKKAVRVESKNGVIEEDFITFGIDQPEIGTVSAIRSNISEVDVDAYYIKRVDEGKEKCVYFRKIGNTSRVFFAEKKGEGHIPFTPYVLSEYSLNEILHGKEPRINYDGLVLADRVIDENETEYISMFMPADHQLKRKNGISMALTNDDKYEFTAFYWKKGKSVPCANSTYIPVLFDALETVTFNSTSLTSPEQAAEEITLEGDDEADLEQTEAEPESEEETEANDTEAQEAENEEQQPEAEEIEPIEENEAESVETDEIVPAPEEDSAEQSAESEEIKPEKKPKKEGFFERRRKKKELKKAEKARQNAEKKEKAEALEKEEKGEAESVSDTADEPVEDEISPEESEALAAAISLDLFSEEELEDIFSNPFDDETESADETPDSEVTVEADEPAETEKAEEEYSEKAQTLAEEAKIIEEEREIIAEEAEELKEEAQELEEEKQEIIEAEHSEATADYEKKEKPAKKAKNKEKKGSLFAKKQKKKKVSGSEAEAKAKKEKKSKRNKKKELVADEPAVDERQLEELSLEAEQSAPEPESESKEFSTDDYFENEKPLTLLQILEAADISNDNKKHFLQYMKPAIMNTVYVVPITDSGEHTDAVYVSKKAANLLEGKDYPIGSKKELILPGDEREELRKHIKLKTIMSSSEAFIPAFTSAQMFEQIFGKNERCGLFAFPNLCSQTAKNEQIKGVIINPEITDLKFTQEELEEY